MKEKKKLKLSSILLLIGLFLQGSIGFAMETNDKECKFPTPPLPQNLPQQESDQSTQSCQHKAKQSPPLKNKKPKTDDLGAYLEYTHSHYRESQREKATKTGTSERERSTGEYREESITTHEERRPIKALYVDQNTEIFYKDKDFSWQKKIWDEEEDHYSRLVKEICAQYPDSPNHLLVSFEIAYWDKEEQQIRWNNQPLCNEEGIIEDYCSNPPKGEDDGRAPEGRTPFLVKCGRQLDTRIDTRKDESTGSRKVTLNTEGNKRSYPILNLLGCELIEPTERDFPHSEILFLNRIWCDNELFPKIFAKLPPDALIKGLLIKLYSYNDICETCQGAICTFHFHLQEKIREVCGIKVPIFFVGVGNRCWWKNSYCMQTDKVCKSSETITRGNDISRCLIRGMSWDALPASKYVDSYRIIHFRKREGYKPYRGRIEKYPDDERTNFFLIIRVPNLDGIKEHFLDGAENFLYEDGL